MQFQSPPTSAGFFYSPVPAAALAKTGRRALPAIAETKAAKP